MKSVLFFFQIALLCILTSLSAQAPAGADAKDTNQKQHAANAIFNEIMQTLPLDMKVKVDSAGKNSIAAHPPATQAGKKSSSGRNPLTPPVREVSSDLAREGAVKGLPEEVRGQVEKAIADIELMNQNRQIQFKEYEKKHLEPR